jgi:hypothetical protein
MKLYWYDKMIYGGLMLLVFAIADKVIIWFTKDMSGFKETIPTIALVFIIVLLLGHILDLVSKEMEKERCRNAMKKEDKKHA